MKTAALGDEFDRILKLIGLWTENRNMALLTEARCALDDMHRLTSSPELNYYQKEVLAPMLWNLSRALEDAENWCPGDRPSA